MEKIKKRNKKTCKNCKDRFQPERDMIEPLCSVECALAWRKKLNEKKWNKEKAVLKITTHSKEYKASLQAEINKLSRLIDSKFGYITCIDCNKTFGKQIDAAHYHSRGSNSSLKYNLDNLHSARSECNQWSDTHKSGYKLGLIERYGKVYTEYVIEGLPLKYPYIKLCENEVFEKLKLVRKLIRDFDTFKFSDSLSARKILNDLIGIY